jgi:hypothetical protein
MAPSRTFVRAKRLASEVVSVGSWLEDYVNQIDARRIRRRRHLPESIEKPYWDSDAFAKDSARLEALGYAVESEVDNDAYVSSTYPANTGGGFGQLSRTVTRRVPSIHVTYRREPQTR